MSYRNKSLCEAEDMAEAVDMSWDPLKKVSSHHPEHKKGG